MNENICRLCAASFGKKNGDPCPAVKSIVKSPIVACVSFKNKTCGNCGYGTARSAGDKIAKCAKCSDRSEWKPEGMAADVGELVEIAGCSRGRRSHVGMTGNVSRLNPSGRIVVKKGAFKCVATSVKRLSSTVKVPARDCNVGDRVTYNGVTGVIESKHGSGAVSLKKENGNSIFITGNEQLEVIERARRPAPEVAHHGIGSRQARDEKASRVPGRSNGVGSPVAKRGEKVKVLECAYHDPGHEGATGTVESTRGKLVVVHIDGHGSRCRAARVEVLPDKQDAKPVEKVVPDLKANVKCGHCGAPVFHDPYTGITAHVPVPGDVAKSQSRAEKAEMELGKATEKYTAEILKINRRLAEFAKQEKDQAANRVRESEKKFDAELASSGAGHVSAEMDAVEKYAKVLVGYARKRRACNKDALKTLARYVDEFSGIPLWMLNDIVTIAFEELYQESGAKPDESTEVTVPKTKTARRFKPNWELGIFQALGVFVSGMLVALVMLIIMLITWHFEWWFGWYVLGLLVVSGSTWVAGSLNDGKWAVTERVPRSEKRRCSLAGQLREARASLKAEIECGDGNLALFRMRIAERDAEIASLMANEQSIRLGYVRAMDKIRAESVPLANAIRATEEARIATGYKDTCTVGTPYTKNEGVLIDGKPKSRVVATFSWIDDHEVKPGELVLFKKDAAHRKM